MYDFYGVAIDIPLSLALGSSGQTWANSTLGRLGAMTKNAVYLQEITNLRAQYGWRVVDAYFSEEDGIITYFRAFGLDGEYLAQASFGVNWATVTDRISGRFDYKPTHGNQYYVPVQNNFATPNTGGHMVEVLDRKWPSEGLAFGLYKQRDHQALVISFRLFELGSSYPNDLEMEIK
jgi:hypothetical protein